MNSNDTIIPNTIHFSYMDIQITKFQNYKIWVKYLNSEQQIKLKLFLKKNNYLARNSGCICKCIRNLTGCNLAIG
jgi:hypothetical protein